MGQSCPCNPGYAHAHAKTSRSGTSTAAPSSSSLRPRTQRLISGLEDPAEFDLDETSAQSFNRDSPFHTPFGSRAPSPIPSANPSRSTSSRPAGRSKPSNNSRVLSPSSRNTSHDTLGSLSKAWGNSWSALQGLASDLLNPDAGTTIKDKTPSQRRRPPIPNRNATSAPNQWGVSTSDVNQIGVGSKAEREALVRARKRENLLQQAANGQIQSDALGRIKRRSSDDRTSSSAPPGENEDRDALVYLHHVNPQDTMAGITIRYNCQAAILRKANRMWHNDNPQVRKILVIPIDASGVKGKPVPAPQEEKAPDQEIPAVESSSLIDTSSSSELPNGWHSPPSRRRASSAAQDNTLTSSHPLSSASLEPPPWTHDSWVLLPNSDKPTEIARLPRRALGFFPPARRKSIVSSASDVDLPISFSRSSPRATPPTSLDLPRTSISPSSAPVSASVSTSTRPSRTPLARRGSSSSNAYYPPYILGGPGGVGSMGRNARVPGPAQDPLNKLFAPHLPNVAPPPNQQGLYFPHSAMDAAESDEAGGGVGGGGGGGGGAGFSGASASAYASGTSTPGLAYGAGLNLEAVGGKIEGWMRKMATRTAAAWEAGQGGSARTHGAVGGTGAGGLVAPGFGGAGTDLIEMNDAFEIGGGSDDEEQREREAQRVQAQRGRQQAVGSTSGRESGSAVRPRARSGAGAGKGKED
ncbi:carbohydrate-binding module family 50 protein [Viridothelium virens]|uniref:Carbohydrate-binding module family 50 protein n=1 Tax=Viridothelium virens TaxID=1048519 RepID=A0A6A6HBU1_VIRVR|nr:carbohydrate-binding module family 50 protein [Viridothelium virens]